MKNDLTDITIIMDRSGSMDSCRTDAEGGLNSFIEQQKNTTGQALLTLVEFDHQYNFVHNGIPIKDAAKYTLIPRGNTALYDAIGRGIVEAGERIGNMQEVDRPGLVVFVVLTDGYENASHEYSKEKIAEMIKHQSEVYKWQFLFLAANQDAALVAQDIDITTCGALNFTEKTSGKAYTAASGNVLRMRSMSANNEQVVSAYTTEEVEAAKGN